jgi:pyruvate formate lyase activating enzyme
MSAENLADKADPHVSCICYFGGDPSVQSPHALKTSEIALKRAEDEKRILRICWETNGYWKKEPLQKAVQLSLDSGGNIKFDLKTYNENLNKALCEVSNLPALENFKMVAEKFLGQRADLPILAASTLLVPGYVDEEEVEGIAKFISELDSQIPYALLAFYPQYMLNDLPPTRREHAEKCYRTAKRHLKNVRIGNANLLS